MKKREFISWREAGEIQHKEIAEDNALLWKWGERSPEADRIRVQILRDMFPNSGNMANLKFLASRILAATDKFQDTEDGDPIDRPAPRILMAMGGHVIKCGCGPIVADLANRGFISALLVNGSWLIHDTEMALFGSTSEFVDTTISGGGYGFNRETVSVFGHAIHEAASTGKTLFECLGEQIRGKVGDEANHRSVIAHLTGSDLTGDPIKVFSAHALGTDTIHNHPNLDWGLIGKIAQHEFEMLLDYFMDEMDEGVWINVGSAVLLPEVYLKTLTAAANIAWSDGVDAVMPLLDTVAVLDFQRPYRAITSVLDRSVECGADHRIMVQGPHEFTLPLLRESIGALIHDRDCLWRI